VAAAYGNEKIVRSLLQVLQSSPEGTRRQALNAQDSGDGSTALHVAVDQGHEGIVKRLVEAGASTAVRNLVSSVVWSVVVPVPTVSLSRVYCKSAGPSTSSDLVQLLLCCTGWCDGCGVRSSAGLQ
jgi:ankyrin repeat protein